MPRERTAGNAPGTPIYRLDTAGFSLQADGDGDLWLPDWPVFMVDWECAAAFARWQAWRTGLPWRLPDELEWEKAGRGTDGRAWPWGDHVDPSWAAMRESSPSHPSPWEIGAFPADESPYGVRDMAGGVIDWTSTPFLPDGQTAADQRVDITASAHSLTRVARGGSFLSTRASTRLGSRFGLPAATTSRFGYLGFRLGRSLG